MSCHDFLYVTFDLPPISSAVDRCSPESLNIFPFHPVICHSESARDQRIPLLREISVFMFQLGLLYLYSFDIFPLKIWFLIDALLSNHMMLY